MTTSGERVFNEEWQIPSIWVTAGSTKSGKSYLMRKVVSELIRHPTEPVRNLIILCPTLELDDDWRQFESTDKLGVVKVSEESDFKTAVQDLIEGQKRVILRYGRERCPHSLLVVDDCLGLRILAQRGLLDNLSSKIRHYKTSLIVITQKLSAVPRTLRLQASYVVLLANYCMAEYEAFLEEFVPRRLRKIIVGMMAKVFDRKYNYLVSDNLNPAFEKRLFKNGHVPLLESSLLS
jgi:hypothetical protein